MEKIIVLINFNSYLGGGETLIVRFAEYLQRRNIKFTTFCLTESYIYKDLKKKRINESHIHTISLDPNYYYLTQTERLLFLDEIKTKIVDQSETCLVTFCMRDLYTAFALSMQIKNCSIIHLILHIQDDLYIGQTLFDKIIYKIWKYRKFHQRENIQFNHNLLHAINRHSGLVSMAEIICTLWNRNFGIVIPDSHVIPLPSFVDLKKNMKCEINTKRIIWIGRLVDFKIPSIAAMIYFINIHSEYSLTIIGEGDKKKLMRYVNKHSLNLERVCFIGEVPYSELGEIIKTHSIGYAMGTSLIELAKYRMPIIIALASYDHQYFNKQICGGLFYNKAKGCDGSDLVLVPKEDIKTTIEDAIMEIEADYLNIAQLCYEFAKEDYSEEKNFRRYVEIINQAKAFSERECKHITSPTSSFFRRYLFKKYKTE